MKNLNRHVFLIGFMGTGKSAISAQLGEMMMLDVWDTDKLITESRGMSIPEIFEREGEDYFRDLETDTLRLLSAAEGHIISCGGGIVLREENIRMMRELGQVVLLTARPQTVYERVKADTQRPLLKGNLNATYIEELMTKRQSAYERASHISVATDDKSVLDICREILFDLEKLEDT
ncbi:shikimate kinase [Aminipila butyrica]|uniref:Shikimate kinase n=1 Tax=Aminipila butyrica TaxID=433296 RepID=A0A858BQF4_9FIRM|nr:shikimate kinase [Aminipila butyrica]QIB68043.1 shikimate kinase [Aminipila butyrica]